MALCNICIHHIHVDHAGGTTPRMGEVESRLEQRLRAMHEQFAEAKLALLRLYEK
ncbi:hypothetical protein ABXJ76_04640 [Methylobacter sp. G7]|uniref:hypothetical protein n=1 Tax=Methylobacter sp. G7 TaxID=3230117 RepID=UPI003D803FAF